MFKRMVDQFDKLHTRKAFLGQYKKFDNILEEFDDARLVISYLDCSTPFIDDLCFTGQRVSTSRTNTRHARPSIIRPMVHRSPRNHEDENHAMMVTVTRPFAPPAIRPVDCPSTFDQLSSGRRSYWAVTSERRLAFCHLTTVLVASALRSQTKRRATRDLLIGIPQKSIYADAIDAGWGMDFGAPNYRAPHLCAAYDLKQYNFTSLFTHCTQELLQDIDQSKSRPREGSMEGSHMVMRLQSKSSFGGMYLDFLSWVKRPASHAAEPRDAYRPDAPPDKLVLTPICMMKFRLADSINHHVYSQHFGFGIQVICSITKLSSDVEPTTSAQK